MKASTVRRQTDEVTAAGRIVFNCDAMNPPGFGTVAHDNRKCCARATPTGCVCRNEKPGSEPSGSISGSVGSLCDITKV